MLETSDIFQAPVFNINVCVCVTLRLCVLSAKRTIAPCSEFFFHLLSQERSLVFCKLSCQDLTWLVVPALI